MDACYGVLSKLPTLLEAGASAFPIFHSHLERLILLVDKIKNSICLHYRPFVTYIYLVVKGDAGKPSLLYKFAPEGLSAQAYRTFIGLETCLFHTITVFPLIIALAQ